MPNPATSHRGARVCSRPPQLRAHLGRALRLHCRACSAAAAERRRPDGAQQGPHRAAGVSASSRRRLLCAAVVAGAGRAARERWNAGMECRVCWRRRVCMRRVVLVKHSQGYVCAPQPLWWCAVHPLALSAAGALHLMPAPGAAAWCRWLLAEQALRGAIVAARLGRVRLAADDSGSGGIWVCAQGKTVLRPVSTYASLA